MSQVKLQKIGNSFGFRVSKTDLEIAEFDDSFEYELIAEKGIIVLVKRRPPRSKWVFKDSELSAEDIQWLESKLESRIK